MSEISKAMDRSKRDARGAAGVETRRPVVAALPQFPIGLEEAEQYLSLASEISLGFPDGGSRAVLFASAVAEEGTSTIAREFAMTLAVHGNTETLLVDANLRRPSVHATLRLSRDPGLSEHVLGDAALVDCLRPSGMPRLSVIPAGRPVIAPARVMSDARMKDLLSAARARFGYVVIDGPPFTVSPEGIQLGRLCDGVVLVIRAGHTRRQLLRRALELLDEAGATVLGTVLNRRRYYIPQFIYDRI